MSKEPIEGELFLKGERLPGDRVDRFINTINCRCVLVPILNEKEITTETEKSPLLLPESKA